jgi:hypothetical protein
MKTLDLFEATDLIIGTSCSNCNFTAGSKAVPINSSDLNENGGTIPTTAKQRAGAKLADVITMPGKSSQSSTYLCKNPTVHQPVTPHMCCNLWSAPGILYCADGE